MILMNILSILSLIFLIFGFSFLFISLIVLFDYYKRNPFSNKSVIPDYINITSIICLISFISVLIGIILFSIRFIISL